MKKIIQTTIICLSIYGCILAAEENVQHWGRRVKKSSIAKKARLQLARIRKECNSADALYTNQLARYFFGDEESLDTIQNVYDENKETYASCDNEECIYLKSLLDLAYYQRINDIKYLIAQDVWRDILGYGWRAFGNTAERDLEEAFIIADRRLAQMERPLPKLWGMYENNRDDIKAIIFYKVLDRIIRARNQQIIEQEIQAGTRPEMRRNDE